MAWDNQLPWKWLHHEHLKQLRCEISFQAGLPALNPRLWSMFRKPKSTLFDQSCAHRTSLQSYHRTPSRFYLHREHFGRFQRSETTASSLLDTSTHFPLGVGKTWKTNLGLNQLYPRIRIYAPRFLMKFWWNEVGRWRREMQKGDQVSYQLANTQRLMLKLQIRIRLGLLASSQRPRCFASIFYGGSQYFSAYRAEYLRGPLPRHDAQVPVLTRMITCPAVPLWCSGQTGQPVKLRLNSCCSAVAGDSLHHLDTQRAATALLRRADPGQELGSERGFQIWWKF